MSELLDPKFASKINTMETYKQMSKTYIAMKDKNKAYYSTDQFKLKNTWLAHMPMSRLNDLLINYNNLDTQIADKSTIRTREIPQSTKWASIRFNTYLDKTTERNFEYDFNHVDNTSTNSNNEERQEHLHEINQGIELASLRWAEQCYKMFLEKHAPFAYTRELQDTKNKITPTIKDNKDAKSKVNKKLSEYNSKPEKEGTMQVNEKKASEKIKYPILYRPSYKIKNFLKQIIQQKDKYIDKISPHSPLFDPILQKTNMRSALSSKYLDENLNTLKYWPKFYRGYISMMNNKSNCPLKQNNILRYDKWLHLSYLMKRYKVRTLKGIFNGSVYIIQMDYGRIIWKKKKTKILDSLYKTLKENYNAARSSFLINFRLLENWYKRMKFNRKKIFEPPPNYIRI